MNLGVERNLQAAKQVSEERVAKKRKMAEAAALMSNEEKKEEAKPEAVVDRDRWIAKYGRQGYNFQHGIATAGELGPLSVVGTDMAQIMDGEVAQEIIAKSWQILVKFADGEGKVPCNSCGVRLTCHEVVYCSSCFGFVFCKACYENPEGTAHFVMCKPHPAWGPLTD